MNAQITTYQSATGRTVTVSIITEATSTGDWGQTITSPCYRFEVRLEGFGVYSPRSLENGLFDLGIISHGGRRVRLQVPASPEASAMWATYQAEVSRRLQASLAADREYQEHYSRIQRAMEE
jgi:hypothetical protein